MSNILLSAYRDRTFYSMRIDVLDHFWCKTGKGFTKEQVQKMLETAGLEDIIFLYETRYWCAVGTHKVMTSVEN